MSRLAHALPLLVALAVSATGGAARADVHARFRPSLRLGGGWSSDLFLGAQLGPSAEGQVAPSARLDVSVSGPVKLWSEYALSLGLFEAPRSLSIDQELELGGRLRLAPGLWLELGASGAHQEFSLGVATDTVGLVASRTLAAGGSPRLRLERGRWSFATAYGFEARRYDLASGERADDLVHLGSVSLGATLGTVWTGIAVRGVRESSSERAFSYSGASAQLGLAWAPVTPLVLRLTGAVHGNFFDEGRADMLVRTSLAPSLALTDAFSLEAAYGFGWNTSTEEYFDAIRHFVYLGVRLEGDLWRR